MNPDPERWNDAHAPVYYPATAVQAITLHRGQRIAIEEHDIRVGERLIHCPTTEPEAVIQDIVKADPSWPATKVVAVDWAAGERWGRVMFAWNQCVKLRRAGGAA